MCCGSASCPASDPCHTAGTCAAGTGVCTDPVAADTTPCDDGNSCTQTDTCQSGVCIGGNPIVCNPIDVCHASGTCNPGTGQCTTPPAAGANCAPGQPCLAWYPDCDGDGFGSASSPAWCASTFRGTAPCGTGPYVQINTDCCDTDPLAHPGQAAFFTGVDGGTTDSCGSWDYDCSGTVEMQYTNLANTCAPFGCAGLTTLGTGLCSGMPECTGFVDPNPACGAIVRQEIYTCAPSLPGSPCNPETTDNPAPLSAGFPVVFPQGCH